MSVNIYDGTNLTPIAGKTVPAPTPDYVDEQFNPSTTYSKGMTCIEGNVRYRYKNSTATSGHRPPDTTYWEVLSVASQINPVYSNSGMTISNKLEVFSGTGTGESVIGVTKVGKIVFFYVRLTVKTGQTLSNPEIIITNLPPIGSPANAGCGCVSSCARLLSASKDFGVINTAAILADDSGTSTKIYLYSDTTLTAGADIYVTGQYISK